MLTHQGRVLHDVFIVPVQKAKVPTYLIIHDSENPISLVEHMKPFKLRSKVRIRDASSDWDVWSAWERLMFSAPSGSLAQRKFVFGSGGAAEAQWSWPDGVRPLDIAEGELGCWDLRADFSSMRRQLLVPSGSRPSLLSNFDQVDAEQYDQGRITDGIPEGHAEIIPGSALPLESCMDIHGGSE